MNAMEISRSGLEVEWRRLEIISENLANAQTVRTAEGGAYQPRVLISGPKAVFGKLLEAERRSAGSGALHGVTVYGIETSNVPGRVVHEPANPQADVYGNVTYPGIDRAAEMTLMVRTARSYEANMVALNLARQMYGKALEIGGRK